MSNQQKLSEKIWEQSSEWIDQIGVVIGGLAKQLGVATEHVYTVYTKQIFFEGVVYSSISLVAILFLAIVLIVVLVATRNNYGEDKWFPRGIALVVLSIIGGIIVTEGLIPNLLKALNPEYYTIKTIIDQIGTMVK